MNPTERSQLLQVLRNRREAIADGWYQSLASVALPDADVAEVRQRLIEATDQALTLLCAETSDPNSLKTVAGSAEALGQSLAGGWGCGRGAGLAFEALIAQLVEGLSADQVAALLPRLAALVSGLAAGFSRKAGEEALHASEERYHQLLGAVTGYTYTVEVEDGQPMTTVHSLGCVAVTGYTPQEYAADPYLWHRMVYEQDRRAVTEQAAQVLSGATARPLEHRMVHRDGSIRWVQNTPVPRYDKHGRLVAYDGLIADVTARKQAESQREAVLEALRETNAHLENLINCANAPIVVWDAHFRITRFNHAFELLTGRREAEVIGQPLEMLFPPALAAHAMTLVRKTLTGEQREQGETVKIAIRHRDESVRTVLWNSATLFAPDGQTPLATIAQGQDITDRKQAEEALENRERVITRILESVPSSLVVIDRSLRIVSVNRNFLDKNRREAHTTLGHKIEEVFPHVLIEYTQLDQKVRDTFRTGQAVEGGKVAYRAPGIHTRIYYYRLIPLKTKETVENVMLLMDDITEREHLGEEVRRAERHLASVVECANDLVVSIDPQGCIVTWNPAAERTLGLETEKIKGQTLISLCAAEHQPVMADVLHGLLRNEKVNNTEVSLLTANGKEVPIAWSCSPMLDDAGKVVGIVAVGRDLTERHQLETQLIQSAKMAALGSMAGGIAHEVRNPLGIISVSAQLLLEHPDDLELHLECARKMHAAAQRASLIIESLLKFARPRSERARDVDLHAALEDIIAFLGYQLGLQKVVIAKAFQPDLPSVYCNLELLQQVFTNLILNACNAMPAGGTLTVETRAGEADQVEICFKDTGQGIPPEHLSKVFDPFFTTMPVGKGVGLGLSISYNIIQQHQGVITVTSQVGQGTTFTIQLPRRPDRA